MKYKIFIKSNSFYWSVNYTYILSISGLTSIFFIKLALFKDGQYLFFDKIVDYSMPLLMIFCLISKILARYKYQILKGKFEGEIALCTDKIIINNKEYLMEDIERIKIYSQDFKGTRNYHRGFEGQLSNGIENRVEIYAKTKEHIFINFLQEYKNEILKDRYTLINYCNSGKLNYLNLLEILNINDYDDIQKFKKEFLTI